MSDIYIVQARQVINYRATVHAETEDEAAKLALYGIGEYYDPEPQDVEIVNVRSLEDEGQTNG